MSRPRYLAAAVLGAALGAAACWHCKPTTIAPKLDLKIPDTLRLKLTLGDLDIDPAAFCSPPATVAKAESGPKLRPGERLLVKLIRHRVGEHLQQNGFALIGGNGTPLTKAKAEELLARLDDDQILAGAREKGALGDGTILERLGQLVDWVVAHKDQILEVVKFVMSLIALFGDDGHATAAEPFALHGFDQAPGAEVGPTGLLPSGLAF